MEGAGLIQPGDRGVDAFVPIGAVERSGLRDLRESVEVSRELAADKRSGKQSVNQLEVF